MQKKHWVLILIALAALVASSLACNPPTPTSDPTVTPYAPATAEPQDAPTAEPPTAEPPTSEPQATEEPAPTEEEAPPPTNTPPPPTDTVTPVPPTSAPTATPEPTATATPEVAAEALEIVDKGYEILDWEALPDSKEWEGHVEITFRGGVPPYTSSVGHRDPQAENVHEFRYAACKGAPVRADVWSADGQHAFRDLWIEAPWCPTPTPTPNP